jgi:hypothetical protein
MEKKIHQAPNLTLGSLNLIAKQMDTDFGLLEDPNVGAYNPLNYSETAIEYLGKIKMRIQHGISEIKKGGKAILDDILTNIMFEYNYFVKELKHDADEFINGVENLINAWINRIIDSLLGSLSTQIELDSNSFKLQEITMERSLGVKAGFKSNILDLFNLVADSSIKVSTIYKLVE